MRRAGGELVNRQIAWYETLLFAQRFAAGQGVDLDPLLLAGTPQWCRLADDDPAKLAALVAGGVREALRNDTRQAATAESSREIAQMFPWAELGRRVSARRGHAYIPRQAVT